MIEKYEECPTCGADGKDWNYDGQICALCELRDTQKLKGWRTPYGFGDFAIPVTYQEACDLMKPIFEHFIKETKRMKEHYGTKKIASMPMTRAAYNQYRGWELPANENGDDEGYLVEYLDGGKPNDDRHKGYISWSPKEQFDAAYQPTTQMSFGHAIVAAKSGHKIARAGWNGKNMFLQFVENWTFTNGKDDNAKCLPFICMRTAQGDDVPWLASQTDVLAEDWTIVE